MIIRFIYLYFLKGIPVYVGSAADVKKRDFSHSRGGSPFDKFLRKERRENFSLQIVEAFKAESRESTAKLSELRESHWIELLRTYRQGGGWNILNPKCGGLLGFSQVRFAQVCASMRVTNKIALKKYYEDPEARKRNAAAQQRPEVKRKRSASMRRILNSAGVKERHVAGCREAQQRVSTKRRMSAAMKAKWADQDVRARHRFGRVNVFLADALLEAVRA